MKSLTADRLRELARTGADVTLKRLRAEMIAIERTFPELALEAPTCDPSLAQGRDEAHTQDVGGGPQGGVGADEAVLGRTPKGAGEGQVGACGPARARGHG